MIIFASGVFLGFTNESLIVDFFIAKVVRLIEIWPIQIYIRAKIKVSLITND